MPRSTPPGPDFCGIDPDSKGGAGGLGCSLCTSCGNADGNVADIEVPVDGGENGGRDDDDDDVDDDDDDADDDDDD